MRNGVPILSTYERKVTGNGNGHETPSPAHATQSKLTTSRTSKLAQHRMYLEAMSMLWHDLHTPYKPAGIVLYEKAMSPKHVEGKFLVLNPNSTKAHLVVTVELNDPLQKITTTNREKYLFFADENGESSYKVIDRYVSKQRKDELKKAKRKADSLLYIDRDKAIVICGTHLNRVFSQQEMRGTLQSKLRRIEAEVSNEVSKWCRMNSASHIPIEQIVEEEEDEILKH